VEKGDSIASEGKGDYMFVEGVVTDLRGNPIPNVTIDTWETDGHGSYDTQVKKTCIARRLYLNHTFLTV
jgi:protocatechuate 3,4-dioxygenase beta subunit